jgi:hypothetical protein
MASWSKGFILQVGGRRYIAMRGTNAGVPMTAKRLQGVSLLYHLVPSAKIPPRLRMFEIVKAAAGREFAGAFARRMTEAMRTAR